MKKCVVVEIVPIRRLLSAQHLYAEGEEIPGMWFNLSLLSKKMDFCQKGLAAYKQNSAGNGFVDHKEGQGLLLTETTGPPNTASTESRGTS